MNLGRRPCACRRVERGLELVDRHPVVVDVDLHDVGLVGAEGGHRPGVGRGLGDDHVAGVDQRLADQVDHLLAAGREDQVLARDVGVLGGHDLDHALHRARRCRRSVRTAAPARSSRRRSRPSAARSGSGGKVEVSGRPPASEMTSGRSVSAIMSRIAEERMTLRAGGEQVLVAAQLAGGRPWRVSRRLTCRLSSLP